MPTILLVGQHALMLQNLQDALERHGMEVRTGMSAEEFSLQVVDNAPDVLILDQRIAESNDFNVRQLGYSGPLILLREPAATAKVSNVRPDYVIEKPFQLGLLLTLLTAVLDGPDYAAAHGLA